MNKYFTYDPENNEFETYATLEEQSKAAKEIIAGYLDDDLMWMEEVEGIISGIITEKATKCGVMDRPKELDDEGYDEEGRHWPEECACICDYEMEDI